MQRIFHDIDQAWEDEWLSKRCGKITTSNFASIMANYGKAFGEPAKRYAMRVALEGKTGVPVETYTNQFMQNGIEQEPIARELYQETEGVEVQNGGFMEYGEFGSSADGLINDDGIVEIKCVIYSTHFANIERGYDPAYKWQIQGQMWIYNRQWVDFVSYCDSMPEDKKLHVYRVERDIDMIKALQNRLNEFLPLIDKYRGMLK